MNHQIKTLALLLVSIVLLTSCAQLRKTPTTFEHTSWKKRQAELHQIKNWTMSGTLSITHHKKRDIAKIKWAQTPNSYNINIFAPLNMGSIRIIGNESEVALWNSNKKPLKAKTPEQLTLAQLGWQLPVSNIRYWILGLPAPKTKINATSFDQYGHLIALNQSGWQVTYSRFNPIKNNLDLPQLIELKNENLAIKLKITNFAID